MRIPCNAQFCPIPSLLLRHKEVVRLAWSACPHDSLGTQIKDKRYTHSEIGKSAHFNEVSTL